MKDTSNLIVVGIGASAGGLQALKPIIRGLQANGNNAYLIGHHLSPTHNSSLADILAGECSLKVVVAENQASLKADHVYVCPPGYNLEVLQETIMLEPIGARCTAAPSIDRLFTSLAKAYGRRSIAIILSGSGHDGTIGAGDIRQEDGLVIVQNPEEAVQPSMPESAIQAGLPHLIGRTEEITDWLNHHEQIQHTLSSMGDNKEALYQELFALVIEQTHFELARYKEGTLKRQTIRRYLSLGLDSLEQYLEYVRTHPEEIAQLQQCFLISVSAFFRDEEAFASLKEALQKILATKQAGDSLRIWVPGCATGEEAYSIAIILAELLDDRFKTLDLRLFATDVDQAALEFARNGIYPSSNLLALSDKRRRWLIPQGNDWQIKKDIRELCVFSVHDITSQPPFIKLDLISCRNLLIYFKPEQQADLISMFHYGLNPGGLLLLGKSESVGQKTMLFAPVAGEQKLFRRLESNTPFSMRFGRYSSRTLAVQTSIAKLSQHRNKDSLIDSALAIIAKTYAPPAVLINTAFEPLQFFGRSQRFFGLTEDTVNFSVFSLCLPELRSELKALCYRIVQENLPDASGLPIDVKVEGQPKRIRLTVRQIGSDTGNSAPGYLIVFEEQPLSVANQAGTAREAILSDNTTIRLRQELADSREHLQNVIEELEASNEEMQSLNEEVQTSSEELQATNEELQSSNEELTTLNDELRIKSQEAVELNETLSNIQNSVRSSLLVVDVEGRITRYNELATRVFGVVANDIGQFLFGLPCHLQLPSLREQIKQVVTESISIVERVHQGSFHFLMQIDPYRNASGGVVGAILNFFDISELYKAEKEQAHLEQRFRQIWQSSLEGLLLVDQQGAIVMTNPALLNMFGYQNDELLGKTVECLLPNAIRDTHVLWRTDFAASPTTRTMAQFRDIAGLKKDGREFFVEVSLSSMTVDNSHYVLATINDITARKNAEKALRRSEEQLRLTLEAANAGTWQWDLKTNVNTWSDKLWALYGYPDASVESSFESWKHSIHPDDRSNAVAIVTEAASRWEEFEVEWRVNEQLIHETRWLFARGIPAYGKSGEVEHYMGIVLDITQRKLLEKQIRDNERRFRMSQVYGEIGSWEADLIHNRQIWSEECFKLFGLPVDQEPQWLESIHPDDTQVVMDVVQAHLDSTKPYEIEYRILKNGSIRWMRSRGRVEHDRSGKPVKMLGIVQDITDRKLAQEALRFSEQKLRLFIEHAPASIAMFDQNMRYLAVSKRWLSDYHLGNQDIIGQSHYAIFPEIDERWKALHRLGLQGEVSRAIEDRFERADGSLQWLRWEIHPWRLSDDSTADGIIILSEDITDRKRAEDELKQYRHHLESLVDQRTAELAAAMSQAEAANVAKSTFLATMSHEIRTPMNAIIGFSQLLKKQIKQPEQLEYLDKISVAGTHLLGVINDILDFSKIEANQIKLEETAFTLPTIITHTRDMLAQQIEAKGLQWLEDIAPELDQRIVIGDPLRLGQILMNLVNNAVKFTETGRITLRVTIQSQQATASLIRFEIQDTGLGISEEQQSRLFHAFEQADVSTTRKFGGTGLGLAFSRKLAELMGGETGVSSEVGKGSCFWFTAQLKHGVPTDLQREERQIENSEQLLRHRYSGARILLAEDDEFNRLLAEQQLADIGIDLEFAENGKIAVAKACEEKFALILMDMQMPEMNGLEATRLIRQSSLNQNTPIIAMTANAFNEDRAACIDAGMNDHLSKPVLADILFAKLLHWLAI